MQQVCVVTVDAHCLNLLIQSMPLGTNLRLYPVSLNEAGHEETSFPLQDVEIFPHLIASAQKVGCGD
jgi:hypothetical protein